MTAASRYTAGSGRKCFARRDTARRKPVGTYFETWLLHTGHTSTVTVVQRYLTLADICPVCDGGIAVTVARTDRHLQVYRLECIACDWKTAALPDPEAK